MIRKLILSIVILAGIALSAAAQETIYLIKNNQVVAKYSADEVDCMSFTLPEGVTEDEIKIIPGAIGKNSYQYTIQTTSANKDYVYCFTQESVVNVYLLSYYGHTIDEASEEEKETIIRSLLYGGYYNVGTKTFTVRDGDSDGYSTFEVLAGQRYIIAAGDLNDAGDDLGEHVYYTTIQTEAPGLCNGTVNVSYANLNENGEAMFNFEFDSDIIRVYTMYGTKSNIETSISMFGLEFCMATFAQFYEPSSLLADPNGWPVDKEDDYTMYVMGVDAEGNQTEIKSVTEHIVPPVPETVGPQISIFSKEKGAGSVKVNFEITPSNVDEAYVRLMSENDYDNRINDGYTPAEIAAGGDAIDITNDIRTMGEYTYSNNNLAEQWTSLIIMAKNAEGCNVTRLNFFPEEGNGSEWSIIENQPSKSAAAPKAKNVKTMTSFEKAAKTAGLSTTPSFKKIER